MTKRIKPKWQLEKEQNKKSKRGAFDTNLIENRTDEIRKKTDRLSKRLDELERKIKGGLVNERLNATIL
ncbi:hypothetical protein M3M44_08550 [Lactobacillus johnsonii]|uniref:hypothetical protein n=1 Tax=Lactobacillus johnsonii TaxID=33959 RepID=UPI00201A502D|nr:hypothetical protein [Lactobacillus johnsonii]MCL5444323.1 hypothetical protein [Lactobacillus johnsonii]